MWLLDGKEARKEEIIREASVPFNEKNPMSEALARLGSRVQHRANKIKDLKSK